MTTETTQQIKCACKWCKHVVEEGMGIYCLRCEDLMDEARMDARRDQEEYEYE